MPSAVAQWTVTSELEAADRLTVKVAVVVPVLPSVTVTSPMLTDGGGGGGGGGQNWSLISTETPPPE